MTTVLFADRDGTAFGPLGARIVPALLPLAGVPVLEHALEALVRAGRRSALLVVGPRAPEIERLFDSVARSCMGPPKGAEEAQAPLAEPARG